VIIIIGLVQGCLDLCPQVRRGTDFLNRPVGQCGDPVDERESHRQHLDLPDHRKAGGQVGHGPSPGSSLVDGPLVDPERRTDDPINSELTLGRADRKGCATPAVRLRGLTVWQHVRLHRVAHDGRVADPRRNVQPDPADRAGIDSVRRHTPGAGSGGKDLLVERRARILFRSPIGHGGAVPVLGMLQIVLRRYLVAEYLGLLGKLQVARVLRHGIAADLAPVGP
jgi:hypothetical protein